jgi:uncharacterized protein (TIGR02147 family)
MNRLYSASAFLRKAGLGANSRGYLKLVVDGKRNLSSSTIRAFSEAMGLKAKQAIYFENLVLYNQAKRPKDRTYYFERMIAAAEGEKSSQFELLETQVRCLSQWHSGAIRELVALDGFKEDTAWMGKMLKNKVSPSQIKSAVEDLIKIGLLIRDENGALKQSEPLLRFNPSYFNPFIQSYHLGMIDRAKDALNEDPYERRSASGVTLSCEASRFGEIRKMVDQFRDRITETFGLNNTKTDSVVQFNVQLFFLSQTPAAQAESSKPISQKTNKGEAK